MNRTVVLLLLLSTLSSATITILPPSPANNSIITGNTTTFNWTADTTGCTGSSLDILRNGQPFADLHQNCNDSVTLSNLTKGNYTWVLTANATSPEVGGIYFFNATPTLTVNLTYPTSGTTFGPGQCWTLVSVIVIDSGGAVRSIACTSYHTNGTLNAPYVLNATQTSSGASHTFNFTTTLTGGWSANCSGSVDGVSNQSNAVNFSIIGTSFCPGGADNLESGWIFTALVLLGGALMIFGVIWWA